MTESAAANIIASRLLVLQSKRLMLSSLQRRLDSTGGKPAQTRVDALRAQTAAALHAYRDTMLRLGSPDTSDFWLVAYGRMIEGARAVRMKLRTSVAVLPPRERYEVSIDIEMLDEIIERWTESMRDSMAAATA